MSRGKQFAIAGLVCTAIALAVGWWFLTFERKTKTIELPPRGEARLNPMYGLQTALRASGQRAQSRERLLLSRHPLQARDTVVLLGNPSRMPKSEADALLKWVSAGGHLVVPLGYELGDNDADRGPLFRGLSLRIPSGWDDDCARVWRGTAKEDAPKRKSANEMFCWSERMQLPAGRAVAAWHDPKSIDEDVKGNGGAVFARIVHGAGSVDVAAELDFLADTNLEDAVQAQFARQLLAPNWGAGTFHLIHASDMPPLWRLLLDHAWMIFVPILLAVFGWLWMRAQRFGPLLPSPAEERRSLLEHVQASGEHLYRYGRAHLLHAALRADVLARLRRRDPVAAALEGTTQAAAIAARTGMPPSEIEQALRSPRPLDAKDFRHRISRLIALRRHL